MTKKGSNIWNHFSSPSLVKRTPYLLRTGENLGKYRILKRLSMYETYFEKSSSSKKFSDEKTFFVVTGQNLLFFSFIAV